MDVLNPANLLFLLLAIPITLLYFLKLLRQKVAVSSTLLWERTLEDLRVNSPFQRIRRSLLLLIQLITLLFLVLSASQLVMEGEELQGERIIVLIDVSASMKTVEPDGITTRFELARREVSSFVSALREGKRVQLMTFDTRAHVIEPFTNDRERLLDAIGRLDATDMGTDPIEALNLARTIIEQQQRAASGEDGAGGASAGSNGDGANGVATLVHVFSDGAFGAMPADVVAGVPIRFHSLGSRDSRVTNIGIVGFAARRARSGANAFVLSCRVFNATTVEKTTLVELRFEGELIDTKRIALPPIGTDAAPIVFNDPRLVAGIAHVKLVRADSLAVDDEAWLVLPAPELRRIGLVSTGNHFLEQCLLSVPDIELHLLAPSDADAYAADGVPLDLWIYDQYAPESVDDLPEGNLVFLNAVPPIDGFALGEPVEYPVYIPEGDPHAILEYVALETVYLAETPQLTVPPWARVIASVRGQGDVITPLIVTAERDLRRLIVVGCDVYQGTNWPRLVSWPIFWSNVLRWCFPEVLGGVYGYSTNRPISVALARKSPQATLTGPAGAFVADISGDDLYHFGYPGRVGLYEVKGPGDEEPTRLAINLLSETESDIEVRENLDIAGTEQVVEGQAKARHHMRELWQICLVIALALLLGEWFLFHRRPFG